MPRRRAHEHHRQRTELPSLDCAIAEAPRSNREIESSADHHGIEFVGRPYLELERDSGVCLANTSQPAPEPRVRHRLVDSNAHRFRSRATGAALSADVLRDARELAGR